MADELDDEALYVVRNYRHLMTPAEGRADRAFLFEAKMLGSAGASTSEHMAEKLKETLTDFETVQLFQKGRSRFLRDVAQRIKTECNQSLTRCARCGGILRTPKAQQCLRCGYDWHDATPHRQR